MRNMSRGRAPGIAAATLLLLTTACQTGVAGYSTSTSSAEEPNGLEVLPAPRPVQPARSDPAEDGDDAAAAAALAAAQNDRDKNKKEGTWEVTLGGFANNDEDFDVGSGQVAGSVGYFVTETIQIVGRQNAAFFEPGEGVEDSWNASTRGAVDFHLSRGELVPFVGASFGYIYGDTVDETFVAGPEAGLKWYLQPGAFAQVMAEYQFFFEEADRIDNEFKDGLFVYGIAIGVRF